MAQEAVRTTQEAEPLSIFGLIDLNVGSAKAVLFLMTVDRWHRLLPHRLGHVSGVRVLA